MTELPVFTLVVRRKRSSGGIASIGMHGKGEVLQNQLHVFGIFIQQLLEDGLDLPAVGSLVVAEDHDRDGGIHRALDREPYQGKGMNDIHLDNLDLIPGGA